MTISINSWVEAALDTDSNELARLIANLPPSVGQSEAAALAQDSELEPRVYAFLSVANEHSAGGDPELAASLATAGIRLCERAFSLHGPGKMNTFLFGVAQFALSAHRACDRLGRRDEQLAVIESALLYRLNGRYHYVGALHDSEVMDGGRLYLRINDDEPNNGSKREKEKFYSSDIEVWR